MRLRRRLFLPAAKFPLARRHYAAAVTGSRRKSPPSNFQYNAKPVALPRYPSVTKWYGGRRGHSAAQKGSGIALAKRFYTDFKA